MPRSSKYVSIGKRKVELSNLNKVLFPDEHIIKAEVIEYYLKIAPTILKYIKGRPLSLVRYPDGITGEKFFQKNRPDWAPEWLEYVELGSGDKKDYIVATEEASLVWLANLACLELHQMHSRKPDYDKPDYIVFDLDPPEGFDFKKVVEIALRLKPHIENYGYTPFAKTTGGKGIHILAPIEPKWEFHKVFDAAANIAKPFIEKNSKELTLHIKKDPRKGRVLIDIYRIRGGQSIISPYSLRGNPGAPVSMPLSWEELEGVSDPKEYNMNTVPGHIIKDGDAWEGMSAYAAGLHTQKRSKLKQHREPVSSGKFKTPETLKKYEVKRDFSKTPEPGPGLSATEGRSFVIHRHHASRLHYDLRLEHEGVLRSWAVPKGLPPKPGVKRLAVQTEDHPFEYLTFEGTIPKGEYGGGDMWIYASGKYEITKQKKDGFYFQLHSPQATGEYRMHRMSGTKKEWLLERIDNPQIDWLNEPVEPMLSQIRTEPPAAGYIYEVKWDGIRVMVILDDERIRLRSRNRRDITKQFPELIIPKDAFRATNGVFDGEIVCLDEAGSPDFKQVINRLQRTKEDDISRGRKKYPAYCYVFDCLYLDGRAVVNEPLVRRKAWMKDALKKGTVYRISESVEDGKALFEAAKKHKLEGIMAKDPQSRYLPGKRSDSWLKIKVRNTAECIIIGYTKGKGDRNKYFGSLHLGEFSGNELEYRGKVGTGFDLAAMKEIFEVIGKLKKVRRPVKEKPVDDASSVWVEPKLYCEIQFSMRTRDGAFREPVFLRLRPDMS